MRLQVQLLDFACVRRFRAMLSKSPRKKAERKELDRLIQDGITERQRYDRARRKRTEINNDTQAATVGYWYP